MPIVEELGLRWWLEDDDDHLALHAHEAALYPILMSMVDSNKSYVNVGAHIGKYSVTMAPYFKHVYAIEANPRTASKLARNVVVNGLEDKISVWKTAFSDGVHAYELVDANGKSTGGSTRIVKSSKPWHYSNVTSLMDDWRFDVPVKLISMDVEGAEAKVLRGGATTILRDRPNLVIELHEGHPGTDPDLREQVYGVLDTWSYSYRSVPIASEEFLICYPQESQPLDDPVAA